MEMVDALEETFSQFRRGSSRFSSSASRKLEGRILATRWEGSISWRITDRREIRGRRGGWLGFFLTRNWTSVRAGEIAKGTETSSNWIRDISAPMIRFNQIAWPDIALLFKLKTRGLCTHFTACTFFFSISFFFFSIESQNVLLERANLFDFPNSVEFERIPRFICFLLKKKGSKREKTSVEKLSLCSLKLALRGITIISWKIDRVRNGWWRFDRCSKSLIKGWPWLGSVPNTRD